MPRSPNPSLREAAAAEITVSLPLFADCRATSRRRRVLLTDPAIDPLAHCRRLLESRLGRERAVTVLHPRAGREESAMRRPTRSPGGALTVHGLKELVGRLADRERQRTEAEVQADLRSLLLAAPFQLEEGDLEVVTLEAQVGDRRRIDVEAGTTVFEVKRDLRKGKVRDDAIVQLAGYVAERERRMGRRYVGVLTDGAEWRAYRLREGKLDEAATFSVKNPKAQLESLLVWLEGLLATTQKIPPLPSEIAARLGQGSSSHALDRASLRDLYALSKDLPAVKMKRELWARLLTTALGSQFEDSDELFVEHTLLVNSAEIIAHAVLGLEVQDLSPASLLSGEKFSQAGVHGVVEHDFFDWVIDTDEGGPFVRTLARRLARFDWAAVEHDVLKVLYESVISAETRKKLGEYYTPDWLAEAMVEEIVDRPLEQRVLDPACGSGTFLFHAVRRFLAAADEAGRSIRESIDGVSDHVLGIDLHPVAVTLARVTYILALGRERLADPSRGPIQVPVFLGDSMQWQQKKLTLFTAGFLVIQIEGEAANLFSLELRLPGVLLEDAARFDRLIEALTAKATDRDPGSRRPPIGTLFQRFGVAEDLQPSVQSTFDLLCRLHDEHRNHIWGYYIRNLARPVWLSQPDNRVDVLIGNPPWLAYRHMPSDLQEQFRSMSDARGLWHGAKVATHQDLSGLFVARTIELYLEIGGRLGFVLPNAALDRAQFGGFRTGVYPGPKDPVQIRFERPWDLRRLRPHFFPRGAAVISGQRVRQEGQRKLPAESEQWTGKIPRKLEQWADVRQVVEREIARTIRPDPSNPSPYKPRFRQGATLLPRVLFMVEEAPRGPLGLASGTVRVHSVRSASEKPPWKDLEPLEGVVESEFVYPAYLGEHVLPYRSLPPGRTVLPWVRGELLGDGDSRLERYPRLAAWWKKAEEQWLQYRSSDRLTLVGQVDYHGKLSAQHPIPSLRIVYNASGMHLCAATVNDSRAVIDKKLYWATAATRDEAAFLLAVLNTATVTTLIRPLMSYGKDERDVDKYIWMLPIPSFDPSNPLHARLVALAAELEEEVGQLELDESKYFVSLRRQLRKFLANHPKGQEIERLVAKLLTAADG